MIAALFLAAAVGTPAPPACAKRVRAARVHLVDGMPFVDAVRRSVRIVRNPDPPPAQVFRVYDGVVTVGYLRFAPDGSVQVSGELDRDPAGRFVDLYERAPRCPLPTIEAATATLRGS